VHTLPLPGLSQKTFCQLLRILRLNSPSLHLTFHTVSSYPQSIPTASPKMGTRRVTSQRAGTFVHASLRTKPLLGDAVGIRRHDFSVTHFPPFSPFSTFLFLPLPRGKDSVCRCIPNLSPKMGIGWGYGDTIFFLTLLRARLGGEVYRMLFRVNTITCLYSRRRLPAPPPPRHLSISPRTYFHQAENYTNLNAKRVQSRQRILFFLSNSTMSLPWSVLAEASTQMERKHIRCDGGEEWGS
jgi:hypothetical protein